MKSAFRFLLIAACGALVGLSQFAVAADAVKCKSLADSCAGVTDQMVLNTPTPATRVGKTNLLITGKTADGKYNVYSLRTKDLEGPWTVGNARYTDNDMFRLLGAVASKDIDHGYTCQSICVDKQGNVVGVPEAYKKIATGKK